MRILVLEDSLAVARLVESGLKAEGFTVTLATTLAQAHDLLAESEFDGMVLDRWVPDGDGLSLVSHLRALGDETPIIMLTTMDKDDQRIEGLRTGADDYLGKPFTMEEHALRLNKLLGRRARTSWRPVRSRSIPRVIAPGSTARK